MIKWSGYDDDAENNSWHTLDELYDLGVDDAEDRLAAFEKDYRQKKRDRPKPIKNDPVCKLKAR